MKITALASVVFLSACATSGVVPIGKDSFMITKQGAVGFQTGSSLKAELYPDAVASCTKLGKEFQPVSERVLEGAMGRNNPSAELTFRCLNAGDSELSRPTMKSDANIRIEQVGTQTPPRIPSGQSDSYAELVKLKQLLDAQIITQDEFDGQKRRILAR